MNVQINLQILGGTKKDLDSTFTLAYSIFNLNKDKTIAGLLEENVTVFSVKNQDPHTGIDEVEAYFLDQFKDGPSFDPTTSYTPHSRVSADGLSGRVWGKADWCDKNGADVINYEFKFLYNGSKWLISMLHARK